VVVSPALNIGHLNIAKPESSEHAIDLLDELLELLTITDMWELPELKSTVGWVITRVIGLGIALRVRDQTRYVIEVGIDRLRGENKVKNK